MSFVAALAHAERVNRSLLCVGLDPDPARFPGAMKGDAVAHLRVLRGDRRSHQGSRHRLQAADRLLRGARRRSAARAPDRLHPRHRARRAGDPRREARRHGIDRRAVRARGLRPLPGRRGDALAVAGLRFDRALPALRGQGRDPAVPHLEPRRRRPAGAAPRLRRAALRAHRPARREHLEQPAARSASSSAPPTRPRSPASARSRRRCRC